MRADIHDGPEQKLQSEAGYIDARPQTDSSTKTSCNARPDHTFGSKYEKLTLSKFSPLCLIERTSMRRAAPSLMGHMRTLSPLDSVALAVLYDDHPPSRSLQTTSFGSLWL